MPSIRGQSAWSVFCFSSLSGLVLMLYQRGLLMLYLYPSERFISLSPSGCGHVDTDVTVAADSPQWWKVNKWLSNNPLNIRDGFTEVTVWGPKMSNYLIFHRKQGFSSKSPKILQIGAAELLSFFFPLSVKTSKPPRFFLWAFWLYQNPGLEPKVPEPLQLGLRPNSLPLTLKKRLF